MTIASFTEMWSAGRINYGKFEATASRTWQINLKSAVDVASGLLESLTHSGLPLIGQGFPGASGLRVVRRIPMPYEEAMFIYRVRIDYQQTIDPENPTEQDPTEYDDKISYSTAKSTVAIEDDEAGDPLLNSAKVQFRGLVKEHDDILITVQRNIDDGAIAHIKLYEEHLNIGVWNTLASNTVRITSIVSHKVVDDTRTYYPITYQFDYRAKGHGLRPLNEGLTQLVGGNSEAIQIGTGADKRPTSEPLPLDAAGAHDPVGSYQDFTIYPQVSFTPLGITL